MRSIYRALAYLVAAGVALQAASVALAFFTIVHHVEDGGVFSAGYDYDSNLGIMLHRFGGGIILLLALALLIVSFFTRAPGAVRWAAGLFGLIILQVALVFLAFGVAASGGALHGLNALAVFVTAILAGRRIKRVSDTDVSAEGGGALMPVEGGTS